MASHSCWIRQAATVAVFLAVAFGRFAAGRRLVPSSLNLTLSPATRLQLSVVGTPANLTVALQSTTTGDVAASTGAVRLCLGLDADYAAAGVDGLPDGCVDVATGSAETATFELRGVRLGRSRLTVEMVTAEVGFDGGNVTELDTGGYEVVVVRPPLSQLAVVCLFGVIACTSVNFLGYSCLMTTDVIVDALKHPGGLFVGFGCQFVVMPVITYVVGIAFGLPPYLRYALLALGCSPGGGPSNFATLILGGDLCMSVIMTFTSSFLSIAMMPLWLCTLGQYILRQQFPNWTVQAPWVALTILSLAFSVPTLIGFVICRLSQRLGRILSVILRIVSFLVLLAMVIGTIYSNVWIFTYLDEWPIVLSTTVVFHVSYTISFLAAYYICRRPFRQTLTIAIEAGIQGLPSMLIVMLRTEPGPESTLGYTVATVYLFNMLAAILVAGVVAAIRRRVVVARSRRSGDGDGPTGTKDAGGAANGGPTTYEVGWFDEEFVKTGGDGDDDDLRTQVEWKTRSGHVKRWRTVGATHATGVEAVADGIYVASREKY